MLPSGVLDRKPVGKFVQRGVDGPGDGVGHDIRLLAMYGLEQKRKGGVTVDF